MKKHKEGDTVWVCKKTWGCKGESVLEAEVIRLEGDDYSSNSGFYSLRYTNGDFDSAKQRNVFSSESEAGARAIVSLKEEIEAETNFHKTHMDNLNNELARVTEAYGTAI